MSLPVALDADGPGAPPRRNGELVFDAPWEGRALGLAVRLAAAGHLTWEEFRGRLIEAIAEGDAAGGRPYYESWSLALERALAARGLCAPGELDAAARRLAARPPGHDHPGHDHPVHDPAGRD